MRCNMKKIILALLLSLFSVTALASSASYLFLQSAPSADLIKDKAGKYTLVLHQGAKHIGYFTNRPVRKSGLLDLAQFKALWTSKKVKPNFTQVPPNAALAMVMNNGSKQSFVAVLSKPQIKGQDVIYHLTKISKNKIKPGNVSDLVIFIDDISWNPGGF